MAATSEYPNKRHARLFRIGLVLLIMGMIGDAVLAILWFNLGNVPAGVGWTVVSGCMLAMAFQHWLIRPYVPTHTEQRLTFEARAHDPGPR